MSAASVPEAVAFFGVPAIAFLAHTSAGEVAGHLDGSTPLDPARAAVVAEIVEVATHLAADPRAELLRSRLVEPMDERTPSLVDGWMSRSGARIDVTASDDPVVDAARRFAATVYPLLLMTAGRREPFPLLFGGLSLSHAAGRDLRAAVEGDETLRRMFPDDDGLGGRGTVYRSTGQGGTVQLALFGQSIVHHAWATTIADGETGFDVVERHVADAVRTVRTAVAGEPATTRALVAFAGLRLPDGVAEIELPFGTLRRARVADRRFYPAELGGTLETTLPGGTTVAIDYAGDVVLDTTVPYRVALGEHDVDATWPVATTYDEVAGLGDTVALAAALGLRRDRPVVLAPTWRVTLDPIGYGGSSGWRDARDYRGIAPVVLDPAEVDAFGSSMGLIHRHRTPDVAVGIRRTLSALHERNDPGDSLLDCVIAWENLFGARAELSFRISMAIAHLLGATAERRAELQKRTKALYDRRSDVVHGRAVDPAVLAEDAEAARTVTLDVWRRLFEHEPQLLRAKERAQVLLLR